MSTNRETIRAAIEAERNRLVPGTVEKYPAAKVSVRILDAEALLAENEQLREALEATRADISRRLAGDSAIDAPFDEDFGDALNRIDRVLAVRG